MGAKLRCPHGSRGREAQHRVVILGRVRVVGKASKIRRPGWRLGQRSENGTMQPDFTGLGIAASSACRASSCRNETDPDLTVSIPPATHSSRRVLAATYPAQPVRLSAPAGDCPRSPPMIPYAYLENTVLTRSGASGGTRVAGVRSIIWFLRFENANSKGGPQRQALQAAPAGALLGWAHVFDCVSADYLT
jgi:hypothetical protein